MTQDLDNVRPVNATSKLEPTNDNGSHLHHEKAEHACCISPFPIKSRHYYIYRAV
jgi:hypothetical protein